MDLKQIDKESILNPIIDELGIIPEKTKEKILIQLSAQFDRILLDGYVRVLNEVLGMVKEIKTIQGSIQSSINTGNTDQSNKLVKMVKTLRAMHEDMKVTQLQPLQQEEVQPIIKTNERELALKNMKFGELIKIAKEKKITINPHNEKDDLIKLILDTEKGE